MVTQIGHAAATRPRLLPDCVRDSVGPVVQLLVGPAPAGAGEREVQGRVTDHLLETRRHGLLDIRPRKRQGGERSGSGCGSRQRPHARILQTQRCSPHHGRPRSGGRASRLAWRAYVLECPPWGGKWRARPLNWRWGWWIPSLEATDG